MIDANATLMDGHASTKRGMTALLMIVQIDGDETRIIPNTITMWRWEPLATSRRHPLTLCWVRALKKWHGLYTARLAEAANGVRAEHPDWRESMIDRMARTLAMDDLDIAPLIPILVRYDGHWFGCSARDVRGVIQDDATCIAQALARHGVWCR